MSVEPGIVPFNDLGRIHRPLLPDFLASLSRLVNESSLVLGAEVHEFEVALAKYEGARFAIGINNGTNAIELALRAIDIKPGDEVLIPAFTFVATAFAVVAMGAIPVLVDVDPKSGLVDLDVAEKSISDKTRALLLVTIHGRVDNLTLYRDFCNAYGLKFIIDGAQSHLGTFEGVGQVNYCDVSTLSFYPGKNLGALGEGGAVLTNSEEIDHKIRLMRDWGAEVKYDHTTWGGNFRLESLQASFLRIKLSQLDSWTRERQKIAGLFDASINENHLMMKVSPSGSHVFHIYALSVPNRESAVRTLMEKKVSYGFHYPKAIHQNPAFRNKVVIRGELSEAELLAQKTLSIPIFPKMTDVEIHRVIEAVAAIRA
jgi:dTDP-4-amino-4,6-dideoxygalactose transaminase